MRVTRFASLLITCLACFSCANDQAVYTEIKDDELSIQLQKIKKDEDDVDMEYRVRVTLSKSLSESGKVKTEDMWYKSDSCFYLLDGSKKEYPLITEPIANGMANCYEYLLLFKRNGNSNGDSLKLVYHDRYINKRVYSLEFKKD